MNIGQHKAILAARATLLNVQANYQNLVDPERQEQAAQTAMLLAMTADVPDLPEESEGPVVVARPDGGKVTPGEPPAPDAEGESPAAKEADTGGGDPA